MTDARSYSIEIGEHGILGVAAHLSISFTDSNGNRLVEINGLATNPATHTPLVMGAAVLGHVINGYVWEPGGRSFFDHPRTRSVDTIGTRPIESLQDDLRIMQAIVDEINAKDVPYQALYSNSNSVAMTVLTGLGYTVEDVRAISTRLTPGINIELLTEEEIRNIIGSTQGREGWGVTGADQPYSGSEGDGGAPSSGTGWNDSGEGSSDGPSNGHNPDGGFNHSGAGTTTGFGLPAPASIAIFSVS